MPYVGKNDLLLTRIAQTYPTGSLIGKMVAPVRKADTFADSIYKDADDAINSDFQDLAENAPSNGVRFLAGDKYSYRTTRKALDDSVLDKTVANEAEIVNSSMRKTKKLTHKLSLAHEVRVNTILADTGKITQTADLTGTDRFDNASYAGTFLKVKLAPAVKAIRDATGRIANTIVIPFEVAVYWGASSEISDLVKYVYGYEYLKGSLEGAQGAALALCGLPPTIKGLKVIIADARVNNAVEGVTPVPTALWGKNIWIGYVPADTDVEDTYGLLTMEYEAIQVMKERITNPRSTKIIVEWDYDLLEADLKTWFLYTNAIS